MELLWALLFFCSAVVLHGLSARLPVGNAIGKFLMIGTTLGLGLILYLYWFAGLSLAALAGVLSYAFACELYIFLFTMVASSVSVRLLLLLREKDLSVSEIQALYDTSKMVECRIDRLVMAGLLLPGVNCFRLSSKGERLVNIYSGLKRFFGHA